MHEHVSAFLQSASEAFTLAAPIFEFGYSPVLNPGGAATVPIVDSDGAGRGDRSPGEHGGIGEFEEPDRLEDLVPLPYADGAARTVISINALEHVFDPRRAVEEMIRILAPGGLLLVWSASSVDACGVGECYWRPTPSAIQRLLASLDATLIGWQGTHADTDASLAIASKPPVAATFAAGVHRFLDRFPKRLGEATGASGWRGRLARLAGRSAPARLQFVLHLAALDRLHHEPGAGCLPGGDVAARFDASR